MLDAFSFPFTYCNQNGIEERGHTCVMRRVRLVALESFSTRAVPESLPATVHGGKPSRSSLNSRKRVLSLFYMWKPMLPLKRKTKGTWQLKTSAPPTPRPLQSSRRTRAGARRSRSPPRKSPSSQKAGRLARRVWLAEGTRRKK